MVPEAAAHTALSHIAFCYLQPNTRHAIGFMTTYIDAERLQMWAPAAVTAGCALVAVAVASDSCFCFRFSCFRSSLSLLSLFRSRLRFLEVCGTCLTDSVALVGATASA